MEELLHQVVEVRPELKSLFDNVAFDNFVDLINYRATLHPQKHALRFLPNGEVEQSGDAELSYSELCEAARKMAVNLQGKYKPHSRVMLLFPAGNNFALAFLACLFARMIAVPCSLPSRRQHDWDRVYSIAKDCDASAVVTDSAHSDDYQEKFSDYSCDVLSIDTLSRRSDLPVVSDPVKANDVAFLQYTSGSTGSPKGVIITHANLMHNQRVIHTASGTSSASCLVSWLPLFHDMGLIGSLLHGLYVGATFVYMSPTAFLQKPFRWLQAISHFKGTSNAAPNFAYELCVKSVTPDQMKSLDLRSWTCASNGAEPVSAQTIDKFSQKFSVCGLRATTLTPCYGLAEGTLMVTCKPANGKARYRRLCTDELEQGLVQDSLAANVATKTLVSVGPVVGDQILKIVNPETLQECPHDTVGEIWIAGESIAQGYWNKPEQTHADFGATIAGTQEGPFFRTGDAGFLDADGELFVSGRLKDMLILNGRNIFPQDIETCCEKEIDQLQGGSSAAFSVPSSDSSERLVLVHELKRSSLRNTDHQSVINDIRKTVMANFQIGVHDVVLLRPGKLSKTTSGKVQRHKNRTAYMSKQMTVVASHLGE